MDAVFWLSAGAWAICVLLAAAGSAARTAAHTALDLQSEYFSIETERFDRLEMWGKILSPVGVAGAAGIAVVMLLRAGQEGWIAAVGASGSVLIADFVQRITNQAASARFSQLAAPLLGGKVAAISSADNGSTRNEPVEQVVDAVEKAGLIEMDEHQMIKGIIHLDRTFVRDIMVPRMDVVAMDVQQSLHQALDTIIRHSVSRIPVYQEMMDHIVGVLYAKDLLRAIRDQKTDVPLRTLLRPPKFVPESQRVDELLQELQKTKVHLAIVVDEYGGTAGIVTIEDVLEEIVGEIQDEYDTGEEPLTQKVSEIESVFNARARITEVNEEMNSNLPDESDTLGGLVLLHLEKMPTVGDQAQVGDMTFTVATMAGRRIKQVRVTKGAARPVKKIAQKEEADQ